MTSVPAKTDVFVVGGGPAGLAAAIAAGRQGFQVTVADGGQPPIDKACGEGLMPGSLEALGRLGVVLDPEQSFTFRGIRFVGAGASVEACFPRERGVGVRRLRLHEALIEQARAVDVKLLWGAPVTGVGEGMVSLGSNRVACRWVIGADGERSRVRRWAGLDGARGESSRFGFRRHYRIHPWTDYIEIHWGTGCQIYVTPLSCEEVGVAVLTSDRSLRVDDALRRFPELARRFEGAPVASLERGAVTASRRLRRVFRRSTALIGDASGSVDAITGEGLSLAFEQALALGDALASGDLRAYQAAHRRLARRPLFMAQLLLTLDRFQWLRPRVLHALASEPAIFARLLAMHVGELSAADFVLHGMLPLGWQLLSA